MVRERMEEEYLSRAGGARDRYGREGREYGRDGYGYDYPPAGYDDREAYGHDYTREYREGYSGGYREGYSSERPRRAEREPPEEYGTSRRALNAI